MSLSASTWHLPGCLSTIYCVLWSLKKSHDLLQQLRYPGNGENSCGRQPPALCLRCLRYHTLSKPENCGRLYSGVGQPLAVVPACNRAPAHCPSDQPEFRQYKHRHLHHNQDRELIRRVVMAQSKKDSPRLPQIPTLTRLIVATTLRHNLTILRCFFLCPSQNHRRVFPQAECTDQLMTGFVIPAKEINLSPSGTFAKNPEVIIIRAPCCRDDSTFDKISVSEAA